VGEKETRSTLLAGGQPFNPPNHAHATMPEMEQVVDQDGGGVLVLDSYLVDAKVLEAVNQAPRCGPGSRSGCLAAWSTPKSTRSWAACGPRGIRRSPA
jgi:hypothetical protein